VVQQQQAHMQRLGEMKKEGTCKIICNKKRKGGNKLATANNDMSNNANSSFIFSLNLLWKYRNHMRFSIQPNQVLDHHPIYMNNALAVPA
jgi:hypothetical protein